MSLTPRQQQFYDLLREFVTAAGHAPTTEELKDHLEANGWGEIRSLNSITQYLDALEESGKLRRERKKRGITMLETADTVSIPVLPNPVSCGAPTNLIEEEASEHRTLSRRLVRAPGKTYLFRAVGDSMNRAGIAEGDFVLVEATEDVRDGDIVLATIDGCGTLKRFKKGWETITLAPESTNPEHQPIYLHADDDFLIAGKVVNVLKN
jgi:repressor LexA